MLHRKESSTPINAKNADTCGLNNMKKRTGLALAGGILEIIAAAFWLSYAFFALYIFAQVENGLKLFDWLQIIFPVCFIVYGILAIIGTMKSELIGFGVTNLLFMGWLIYKACAGNAAVSQLILIILLFSTEFILLILSSCFFFFSKESEYEIVFDEKYKQYMSAQPPKFKKIKKIYIISCVALTFLICLAPVLINYIDMIGLVTTFVALLVIFIILSVFALKDNKSKFKLKSNIIFASLAIVLAIVLSFAHSASFYKTSQTVYWTPYSANGVYYYHDSELNEDYVLFVCENGHASPGYYDEIECISNTARVFYELPENAIKVSRIYSGGYRLKDGNYKVRICYEFFDANSNYLKYYYVQGISLSDEPEISVGIDEVHIETIQIVNSLPPEEVVHQESETWKESILLNCVSFLICAAVILCTYNFQFKQDVKKMLKEQENKKIVEKYSAEIPQRIVLQPNSVAPQPKQDVERTTEEKKNQKGEGSKNNVEKNSSETPVRIVLPPRPPMPPTSKK